MEIGTNEPIRQKWKRIVGKNSTEFEETNLIFN